MLYQTKMIDEMMRGLVSTPMEFMDQFMSGEITNHLFEEKNIPKSGLDLAALNIQRGRDHGLKSYNEYRVACNLKRAHNFDDLAGEINQVRVSSKDSEQNLDLDVALSLLRAESSQVSEALCLQIFRILVRCAATTAAGRKSMILICLIV